MINDYRKACKFLESFLDYEKIPKFNYRKSFDLSRVKELFNQLNIAYRNLPVIHIAGTKGKGSTAAICAQILANLGFKVGLYTSPHLFDFRERIQIVEKSQSKVKSRLISQKELTRIVSSFKLKLSKAKLKFDLTKISFFEISTALAFRYFLKNSVDYAVIETGLGGRLDATNLVKPKVSIITHIGYDHTALLGKSLNKIAVEKAGIIKPGLPVVSAEQQPEALAVIQQACRKNKSQLLIFGRDFKVSNIAFKANYSLFDYQDKKNKLSSIKLSLLGKHQIQNAALSLAACFLLRDGKLNSKSKFKLANLTLPGRFELLSKKPLLITDVAHNLSSFSVLSESLKLYYPNKKIILIFGCSQDKDAKAMLKAIAYENLILTSSQNPRALSSSRLKQYADKGVVTGNINQAFKAASQVYNKDCLILVSGSLFLAAEAKQAVKSNGFFRNYS